MLKLALRALVALPLVGATAAPAMAVIDDGSGCGCIRPCHIIERPTVAVEKIATICFGAVRDNYVEPDADYSCSALL